LGLRVENERPARFFTHVPDMHFGPPIDVAFSRWNLFFTAGGKNMENGWKSSETVFNDKFFYRASFSLFLLVFVFLKFHPFFIIFSRAVENLSRR
jgi:hypothetical protein